MNIANRLSVIRITLVPVFVGSLLYYASAPALFRALSLGTFTLACVTDGVDGYLARRLHQHTVLGSYIDPIADKLLLTSGFLSLSLMSHLPVSMQIPGWVTITVIARDVIIMIGSAMIFVTTGTLKAQPLFIGKITTVTQMITLMASLLSAPLTIQLPLYLATVALTILSGVWYIRVGGQIIQSS